MSFVNHNPMRTQFKNRGYKHKIKVGFPRHVHILKSKKKSLENEIFVLRSKMEHAVNQECSLTSDVVVQISSKLDRKINEYMKLKLRKS